MDEKIDALDEQGRPTGKVVWKSEAHRRGIWHRCFHCWVTGTDNSGEPYLLVQRRAAGKSTWPGRLDVTAAGHLAAGEETLDGLRELEEELGLSPDPERLVSLGTRRIEQDISQGCDREFHDVFLLQDDTPPEKLRLQEEEVESVLRINLDAVEKLEAGGAVAVREWRGTEGASGRITMEDFVPNEDDYLMRVARAARRMHAGEEPGGLYDG
ncbi:MAG: NUDIX domain-containing protein [Actinomycetota bacterium]|nr:NUDIX domain-containing protein [Actinomycetota bacterium]HZY65326.1 NUDIX domain-containing protein [Rubrobacteraceae bacterium]